MFASFRLDTFGDDESLAAMCYTPYTTSESNRQESLSLLPGTGVQPMKAHILVVDDDPRITDLLRRIFAYEGYSVAVAASGEEAFKRTLERPPTWWCWI